MKKDEKLTYEIVSNIAVISEIGSWCLELNRVSWNGQEPKYDLRKWSKDHSKMSKGIAFSDAELIRLQEVLTAERIFLESEED